MRYFTTLVTLALALSFAACSQDAVEEAVPEAPGNVHITLSAPFNAPESRAPQSAGYTAEVDKTRELIESYYVVFTQTVSGTEKIVKVIEKADAKVGDNGIESERLDLELRTGTYKVYAFANIPFSYLNGTDKAASKPGYNLTEGQLMPDLSNVTYLLTDDILTEDAKTAGKHAAGRSYFPVNDIARIPMTSINGQEIHVTERTSQKFGIEVVRMLGKVEFQFRNTSPNDLVIKGIKMSDLTINNNSTTPGKERDGAEYLMNRVGLYDDHDDFLGTTLELPLYTKTAPLDVNYTVSPLSPIPLAATSGTATASFYVLESQARAALDDSFELDFTIDKAAASGTDDLVRFAITKPDNFTTIHRNDWIVIPISVGEWVMRLEAFSYPPIGGYPEAKVDADNSGNFHVTFSSPGDISFYPVIHKYYSTTDYFYLNDPVRIMKRGSESLDSSVEPTDAYFTSLDPGEPYVVLQVDDPSGIFTTAPSYDPASGEILAVLNDTKAKATITLAVRFYKDAPPTNVGTIVSKIVVEHRS